MSEPTTVTMAHHISAVCIVSHPFTGRKSFLKLEIFKLWQQLFSKLKNKLTWIQLLVKTLFLLVENKFILCEYSFLQNQKIWYKTDRN